MCIQFLRFNREIFDFDFLTPHLMSKKRQKVNGFLKKSCDIVQAGGGKVYGGYSYTLLYDIQKNTNPLKAGVDWKVQNSRIRNCISRDSFLSRSQILFAGTPATAPQHLACKNRYTASVPYSFSRVSQ